MTRQLLTTGAAAALAVGCVGAQTEPTAGAQAAPAPVRSITQVSGDVYRFQDNQHFGMFMATSEGIVVVDPINLAASEWLAGELDARFDVPVTHVVYSHHHWDHASGGAAFPDATLVTHAAAVTALAGPAADTPLSPQQQAQDANGDGLLQRSEAAGPVAANFDAGDENGDGALTAREAFLAQFANVRRPDQTFNATTELTLGGQTVRLVPVGGLHAADMTYVLFPAEKVLFVVDVISIKRLPFMNLPGYDEADSNALFDKALALDFETIVPGHGDIGARQDVADHQRYFADLKAGVQAGISAGQSLEQIQASLTLDQYASWGNYEQWRALNIAGMHAYLTR
jgi:glyoxylase-like metal-dependent hydrolase (beta-lactamase superfamily II)